MKKIKVFDFDGVLFSNPSSLHKFVLEKYKGEISYLIRTFISLENSIPDHFYDIESGRKYISLFTEFYYSEIMSQYNRDRIDKFSEEYILVILSCNREGIIRKKLISSSLLSYFDKIFIADEIGDKTVYFDLIKEHYNVSLDDISFITDTVSDIKEAQNAGIRDIYAVVADKNSRLELLNHITENKIISGFYKI